MLLALYGAISRPSALGWLLLGWTILALAKTFGLEPIVSAWNLLPGIPETSFYRYATPTWELAMIILAARCIDGLRSNRLDRVAFVTTLVMLVTATAAGSVFFGRFLLPNFAAHPLVQFCATVSALWTLFMGLACVSLLTANPARWKQLALATLLIIDSMLTYAAPTLSNPRDGQIDMAAIQFLRDHLGLQRFYTLGPIHPNYGAYFGIGSVNHVYLPVARRWTEWVDSHLDRYHAYPNQFTGQSLRKPDSPTAAEELRKNVESYEWTGVKYVVAPASTSNPFIQSVSSRTNPGGNVPLQLQPGQSVSGTLPMGLIKRDITVAAVGVF